MSTPTGPIALLTEDALRFVPEPPEFEQLAADELGLEGSDQDGFDSIVAEAAAPLADAQNMLNGLAEEETAAAQVVPTFNLAEEDDLQAEIEPAGQAADQALNDFEGIIAPPPEEGGGGNGSGGGTGGTGGGGSGGGGGIEVSAPWTPVGYEGEPIPKFIE